MTRIIVILTAFDFTDIHLHFTIQLTYYYMVKNSYGENGFIKIVNKNGILLTQSLYVPGKIPTQSVQILQKILVSTHKIYRSIIYWNEVLFLTDRRLAERQLFFSVTKTPKRKVSTKIIILLFSALTFNLQILKFVVFKKL